MQNNLPLSLFKRATFITTPKVMPSNEPFAFFKKQFLLQFLTQYETKWIIPLLQKSNF